jgi:DNA-binding SARP family transcriptional activator
MGGVPAASEAALARALGYGGQAAPDRDGAQLPIDARPVPTGSRIEILGPVRAWRGGHEIPLGPPQQRGVLLLLTVAAGRPVRTLEIIEALWESHPPRTAVNVVQTYLKRLRRLLEPDRPIRWPSQVLPSVGDGYALHAGPYTPDLTRFRQLTQQARRLLPAGDPQRIGGLLRAAVALWQGPPGSDLPALANHHRIQAVLEEHRAAVGWLAETSLASGTVGDTLPLVAQAAGARPLDESLQADLIRLYHAAGRRSEAVRTYLKARRQLQEKLGLDPGPELVGAYRALLHQAGQADRGLTG